MTYPVSQQPLESVPGGVFRRPRPPEFPAVAPGFIQILRVDGQLVERKLTAGEKNFGKVDLLFTVDTRPRTFEFAFVIPSKGDVFDFSIQGEYTIRVTDPMKAVEAGIEDYDRAVQSLLMQQVRDTGRDLEVTENAKCEIEVRRVLSDLDPLNNALAQNGMVVTTVFASILLDLAAREHSEKMKDEQRKRLLISEQHATEKQLTEQRQELDRINQRHWSELLQGGEYALMAAQLGKNPEDLPTVLADLRNADQARLEVTYRAFSDIANSDKIDDLVLQQTATMLVKEMGQMMQQRLGQLRGPFSPPSGPDSAALAGMGPAAALQTGVADDPA